MIALYWQAMYVSELWYNVWTFRTKYTYKPLYYKARGIVVFDRAINQEFHRTNPIK